MEEFQIIWNWNWFLLGCVVSLASEILNLRTGSRNLYKEKNIAGTMVVDYLQISKSKIIYILFYIFLGGFFVMVLDPNNIVTALVIGAAWDKVLIKMTERYIGK